MVIYLATLGFASASNHGMRAKQTVLTHSLNGSFSTFARTFLSLSPFWVEQIWRS